MNRVWMGLVVAMSLVAARVEGACLTRVLPPQTPEQRFITLAPGESLPLLYLPPANGASLVFWSSHIPAGAPAESVRLAAYHFLPDGTALATGIFFNTSQDTSPKNFALSTPVQPGEWWAVIAGNTNPFSVTIFLAVTIRECMP